ncbi:MAG: FAD-dependent oxidoreductase [Terriglobia bacterium]
MWQKDESLGDFLRALIHGRPAPGVVRRPKLDPNYQSNVPGLYIVGDLAGAPLLKTAINQGVEVIRHLKNQSQNGNPGSTTNRATFDVVIVGAGAAGLSAAREAQKAGMRYLLLEQGELANTISIFPHGKILYAEPVEEPLQGEVWLEDKCTKEDLLEHWQRQVAEWGLEVREREGTESVERRNGTFRVRTSKDVYEARSVVLGIGKFGNPRKLRIPGEDRRKVEPYLRNPESYGEQDIAIVGGGDVAAEAALALLEHNRVTMIVLEDQWVFPRPEYRESLDRAARTGKLAVHFQARAREIREKEIVFEANGQRHTIPNHAVFVMVGQELPERFLKGAGIKLEGEKDLKWWATLASWFLACYTVFGIKSGLWPFNHWPAETFNLFRLQPAFWYSLVYTVLVVGFGIPAMRKWGRKDPYQRRRFLSLMAVQAVFGFALPELIFNLALHRPDYWRFYGLEYAWPLFFNTFFDHPGTFFAVWGALFAFVLIPLFVLFFGKRYCTWICGCGALAETLGDRWRTKAPRGVRAEKWEIMNVPILALAVLITLGVVADVRATWFNPHQWKAWYSLYVDLWLVGILAVTVYPILGGKIWCRYWCPLAKYMEWLGMFYRRRGWSRKVQIDSNDKCIRCGECSRHCEVGINVMAFAMNRQAFDNSNTACVQCGICITVCPVDVLTFGSWQEKKQPLIQIRA